jgi:AmmeMemoRadiSam system protein B
VVRPPAVAGRFYPEDPDKLKQQLASLLLPTEEPPRDAIACVVPHAAYRYSGHVAGAVYARLKLPSSILLIGPRHFPRGKAEAILSSGAWETPLGQAQIDSQLAGELRRAHPRLLEDGMAHQTEHAVEVQLPFLQFLLADFRFVPVALGPLDYAELKILGEGVARVLQQQKGPVLIIASSDMNHYESDEITRRKDGLALERVLALDARGLYDIVGQERITMCGAGPVVSTLIAARLLGANRTNLVRYATSADITGDTKEVVGYAGVTVT